MKCHDETIILNVNLKKDKKAEKKNPEHSILQTKKLQGYGGQYRSRKKAEQGGSWM